MEESIKSEVKKHYARIALTGNSDCCCMPCDCDPSTSVMGAAEKIGYDSADLKSIPEGSVLGVGCGAPLKFAEIEKGETVVDLGSGAGIDVFLSANEVGENGKVIGIDMTEEMLDRARRNALENNYSNVEFRKGEIESDIPVESSTVDLVISNCVINLTTDKAAAFKHVHRILKPGGRMIISDLVTDREVSSASVSESRWCGCIDGALTRENYLESIRKAGFGIVEVLEERPYVSEQSDGRNMTSVIVKAVKS
ncbi:MAG: arsenite methyltransferase [Nitrososphaera sp.]